MADRLARTLVEEEVGGQIGLRLLSVVDGAPAQRRAAAAVQVVAPLVEAAAPLCKPVAKAAPGHLEAQAIPQPQAQETLVAAAQTPQRPAHRQAAMVGIRIPPSTRRMALAAAVVAAAQLQAIMRASHPLAAMAVITAVAVLAPAIFAAPAHRRRERVGMVLSLLPIRQQPLTP